MTLKIRLAVRDWDYVTPLLLGDVRSERLVLKVDRVDTLVFDVAGSEVYDAAEVSFSRYAQLRHDGDDSVVGIPNFIMRGFRHRCIITTKDSPLHQLSDLKDKKIGVTGWRDSGNVWTRSALRRAGVGIEDVRWYAGRLTAAHPIVDRLDGFGRAGRIEACPGEKPMVDLLREGFLDAIFTPFMPEGFFDRASDLRPVLEDVVSAEIDYFNAVGYIPGMHVISVKAPIVADNPWVVAELSRLVDAARSVWLAKRRKYADTSPFMLDELRRSAAGLPETWAASGMASNRKMIGDFADELYQQQILPRQLTAEELFPHGFD